MGSTFGSFEIGRRPSRPAERRTGYRPEYCQRQHRRVFPPACPDESPGPARSARSGDSSGYGVAISDIRRIKSEFYGDQIMKSTTSQNYWKRVRKPWTGLSYFQEPEETGINTALNEFLTLGRISALTRRAMRAFKPARAGRSSHRPGKGYLRAPGRA